MAKIVHLARQPRKARGLFFCANSTQLNTAYLALYHLIPPYVFLSGNRAAHPRHLRFSFQNQTFKTKL